MPIPIVSSDPGPDWALNINASLTIVDSHDHSSGKGVKITPAGLNINADLPFNNNNGTLLRSSRYFPQPSALSLGTDLGCVYVAGVDLYFNDVNGNQIRLTQSGSIVGTAGSISGLPSGTASASYQAVPQTFVWQSATNTPANMDGASYVLRNLSANSHGLTLSPPSAMGADYSLVLPLVPAQTNIVTLDSSGNFGASLNVDNSTLDISGNRIEVKDGGITNAKLGAINSQISSSSGLFATTGSTPVAVTNLSVTITTVGRPVWVGLIPDGSVNNSSLQIFTTTAPHFASGSVQILNGSTVIAQPFILAGNAGATTPISGVCVPLGAAFAIDAPTAGTITYSVKLFSDSATTSAQILNAKLFAYEL